MATTAKSFNVTVFGGGTFGTAVGTLIARNGHQVKLLVRREPRCTSININHKNPDYLAEYTLPDNVTATMDAKDSLTNVDIIIHSIPVQASTQYLKNLSSLIPKNVPIVSLSKGIHLETLKFMCDIFEECLGKDQPSAYLSGPSFARELMDKQPTGLVVASTNDDVCEKIMYLISSANTRVYKTDDVKGVEVGGALKNIFAIAAGMAEGLGFQLNTAGLICTRGCSEMKRLAVAMGAREETLFGLSGIGDLMLTCFGSASRNRTVGKRLGQGESLDAISKSMKEVAEGVPTAGAAMKLCEKYHLDLPIIKAVAAILAGRIAPREALELLMTLPSKPED